MINNVKFLPFDELDRKCKMSMGEFIGGVNYRCHSYDDGVGYYASNDMISNVPINFDDIINNRYPHWATHVVWYNR